MLLDCFIKLTVGLWIGLVKKKKKKRLLSAASCHFGLALFYLCPVSIQHVLINENT